MEDKYIFYQGWTKKSADIEKFMKEREVPYVIVHQEIGEKGVVFTPDTGMFYDEKDFDELRIKILGLDGGLV